MAAKFNLMHRDHVGFGGTKTIWHSCGADNGYRHFSVRSVTQRAEAARAIYLSPARSRGHEGLK